MLKTKRLLLKEPSEVTATAVCNYYIVNKEFLKAYEPIRERDFYTEAHHQNLLNIQITDFQDKRSCRFYISTIDNPEEIIGFIALNGIVMGAFCSCYLSYGLDETHRNSGFMTEATKAMIQYAFETLKLHRLEGNIMPRNKASIAVVEKCGFEYEGISKKYLKIHGVWEDHAHYVLLNEKME